MRKSAILTVIILAILGLLTSSVSFAGNEVSISGQLKFSCDLNKFSMEEKYGHKFIKTIPYETKFVTALYGISGAEVIIKNSKNEIIGLVKTNSDGTFKTSVESSNFFTIDVDFFNKKISKSFSKDSVQFIEIDFGHLPMEYFMR